MGPQSGKLLTCTAMRVLSLTILESLALCLVPTLLGQSIDTPTTVIDDPRATRVVKLEFGHAAITTERWTGEASLSEGTVLAAWGWHFNRPDRIIGSSGWDLQARLFNPPNAPYRFRTGLPNDLPVLPNGVYLSLDAPASATLSITTNHGEFSFRLGDLEAAGRLDVLGGRAAAAPAPAVRPLTRGEATQHDFPAAIANAEGLFVAWTAFHNEANAIYLARQRDDSWETSRVTPEWGDYAGTAIASDRAGKIHILWSEYRGGRWRLVDRAFDPDTGKFGRETYVSAAGYRQFFPVAATAADGSAWVAWQEFRDGQLDIMASRFDSEGWSEAMRVSQSDANDWAPDLTAAPDGSVWAVWDGYETGSYGVYLRRLTAQEPDPVIEMPSDPNRAIEPSIAVSEANHVWVAWAESGPNWGKDFGVLGRPGTQLRASSQIRLARLADGRWSEPVQSLEESVPVWMSDLHEHPELVLGPNGVPYVLFRKMELRLPVAEHQLDVQFGDEHRRLQPWYDTIRAISDVRVAGFDGNSWHPVRDLPLSAGGAFGQLGLATSSDTTTVVWATDGRSYEDPHVRTSQLRYARLNLGLAFSDSERMQPLLPAEGPFEDAAPSEAADLARVREARWAAKSPLRLYRGDLHRHTDLSADSQMDGDLLFQYRYALDVADLDFLAVTDHSGAERLHYYKYQWWRNRQVATMFNRPGHFATFFGYERTVTFPGGHRNVISTRRDAQPVPISDLEFTGVESWAERLYPELIRTGDIAIAHTTAGGGGTDWRDNDPRAEPVVEVFQALRGSYEEPGTPAKAGTNRPAGFVWNAWRKGWRLGLLANSDHESTHQSYACVWAPELTSEAILGAIKQRLSYAASDNIILQFEALHSGEAHKMGSEVRSAAPPHLRLRVTGTAPIQSLEIIRSGAVVYSDNPGQAAVLLDYLDEDAPESAVSHYHLRIVQQDGQIAWGTPIWVDRPGVGQ